EAQRRARLGERVDGDPQPPPPVMPADRPAASPASPAGVIGAERAEDLLTQGVSAYQRNDLRAAQTNWFEAAKAGPGSKAAQKALLYIARLNEGKNPFRTD